MHDLDRAGYEQQAIERYIGTPPAENLERVSAAAAAMARTAAYIPQALDGVELEPEERQAFQHLVGRLQAESLQLQRAADRKDLRGARSVLERIHTTCNECHTRFRLAAATP